MQPVKLAITAGVLLTTTQLYATSEPGLVFYSDNDNDQVYKIDIPNMSVRAITNTADQPYPIDLAGFNRIYVTTRNDPSVGVINVCTYVEETRLALNHIPRSSTYNSKNKRILVSGKDKPQTTLIKVKSSQIKQVVGSEIYTPPADFGGSNATGHAFWVSKRRFLQLDRTTRTIQMYRRNGALLDTLQVPSAVHHVLRAGSDFYAVLEGSPLQGIRPGLLRFQINGGALQQTGLVFLEDPNGGGPSAAVMGGHHASIHPDGVLMYMGSTEGNLFVIDRNTMTVVAMTNAGLGAGHTTFAADRNLALITNHNDTFVSVIDTLTHQNIADIPVASAPPFGRKSQGHTASVSPDGDFYYGAASHDGVFFEIDLQQLAVSRTLPIANTYLLQGTFLWGEQPDSVGGETCI
jgi:YVTN family beta-propeller protein